MTTMVAAEPTCCRCRTNPGDTRWVSRRRVPIRVPEGRQEIKPSSYICRETKMKMCLACAVEQQCLAHLPDEDGRIPF